GGILMIIANIGFAAANVFYNAFLVDITTEDRRDRVSSYGYGAGYIGGFLMLIGNLLMIEFSESLGITKGTAVRISFLIASLWWGVFAFISFRLIQNRGAAKEIPENRTVVTVGF